MTKNKTFLMFLEEFWTSLDLPREEYILSYNNFRSCTLSAYTIGSNGYRKEIGPPLVVINTDLFTIQYSFSNSSKDIRVEVTVKENHYDEMTELMKKFFDIREDCPQIRSIWFISPEELKENIKILDMITANRQNINSYKDSIVARFTWLLDTLSEIVSYCPGLNIYKVIANTIEGTEPTDKLEELKELHEWYRDKYDIHLKARRDNVILLLEIDVVENKDGIVVISYSDTFCNNEVQNIVTSLKSKSSNMMTLKEKGENNEVRQSDNQSNIADGEGE